MKTIVELLAEMPEEKSNNGCWIVKNPQPQTKGSSIWNTCFYRWAQNFSDRIEIRQNSNPKFFHTYTRIPLEFKPFVFFMYINQHKNTGIDILLPEKAIVIGGYEAQPSGEYLNYSYLFFCPTGEPPTIGTCIDEGVWIQHKNSEKDPILLTQEVICNRPLKIIPIKESLWKKEIEEVEEL